MVVHRRLTAWWGLQYIRGFDHYNFIRKPASDFGWDWGPAFSPSGVYGNITLEAYSAAYLTGQPCTQTNRDLHQEVQPLATDNACP